EVNAPRSFNNALHRAIKLRLCYNGDMSLTRNSHPLQQLELIGSVPDSGVVDRMAAHQRIAVPHWVETCDGCLVGRYSSLMPVADTVAAIRSAEAEGDPSSGRLADVSRLRQLAAERPNFQPRYTT